MATHSRILAQRIPWTEEPGRLVSIGSQRVRQDRSDLACMHARLCLGFPGGTVVKNLPNIEVTRKTWVQLLGQEDSLEEEMAICSSIPACIIPWILLQLGGLQSVGSQRDRHDCTTEETPTEALSTTNQKQQLR